MFLFHNCMQVSEDGGHRLGAGVLGKHQTGVARAIWEAVKHTKTPAEEQILIRAIQLLAQSRGVH